MPGPRECPTCGEPIRLTHVCRASRARTPLVPVPADWRERIARARDGAPHEVEAEQLPLIEDGDL